MAASAVGSPTAGAGVSLAVCAGVSLAAGAVSPGVGDGGLAVAEGVALPGVGVFIAAAVGV